MSTTLLDLGEREIVRRLTSRYASHDRPIGDDCAVVTRLGATHVLCSTDPAPRPVAFDFGHDDYYFWGWLLVALNVSDINAAGATPAGFMTSLTLPTDFPLHDFNRLLDGIDEACAAAGTEVIGGNIREDAAGRVSVEGTALGTVQGSPLRRSGAEAGDILVAFGKTGWFWTALEALRANQTCPPGALSHLLRPQPLVPLGANLHRQGLLRAATDASDGLYAAVVALTTPFSRGALLNPLEWPLSPVVEAAARAHSIQPWRLALGFGDLQLVAAVDPGAVADVTEQARQMGHDALVLGAVTNDDRVTVSGTGDACLMSNFDNERFSRESQFVDGLVGYRRRLLTTPLTS